MGGRRLSVKRRLAILACAAVAVTACVLTLRPVVPRPVLLVVSVESPPANGLEVRTVVSARDVVVAEMVETARGPGPARLRYRLWLQPVEHRVEIRGRGCPPIERTLSPRAGSTLALTYRCRVAASQP